MQLYPKFNVVIWCVLLSVLIAVFGLTRLQSNASYLAYFDSDDSLVEDFLAQRQRFDKRENLVLLLRATGDEQLTGNKVFYRTSVSAIKALKALPQVRYLSSYLAELRWRENFLQRTSTSQVQNLLSKDAKIAMLVLDVELDEPESAKQILRFTQQVEALLDKSFQGQSVEVILSGTIGLNRAYIETVRHDLLLFFPSLLLVMLLCLYWFFRSLTLSCLLIGTGVLAALAALGTVSWMGYALTSINIFTPIIIIGLSIVMNMHNVAAYYQRLAKSNSAIDALQASFSLNLVPLLMSAITTALGFLLLLSSPSPPVVVTGIACALGIGFSLMLSLSIFQRQLFKLKPRNAMDYQLRLPKIWCENNSGRYKKVIVLVTAGLAILSGLALSGLKIDDNVYRYFAEDYDFSRSIVLIDRDFSGSMNINYQLRPLEGEPVYKNIEQLKALYQTLQQQPKVSAVLPALSLLNNDNIERYLAVGTSKSPLLTYLDRAGENLRIEVRLKQMSASELLLLERQLESNFKQHLTGYDYGRGSSADLLFANLSYTNARSMLYSLLLALTVISIAIALVLKSPVLAALVFVCNFLPVLIGYGMLALSGGYLTLGSTVVIGMIIGIIVDDTIHLLYKYKKLRASVNNKTSIQKMHKDYFAPVIISSITICCALAVGLVSDFKPIFEISVFSILVIMLALLVDILLLPALLQLPSITAKLAIKERR